MYWLLRSQSKQSYIISFCLLFTDIKSSYYQSVVLPTIMIPSKCDFPTKKWFFYQNVIFPTTLQPLSSTSQPQKPTHINSNSTCAMCLVRIMQKVNFYSLLFIATLNLCCKLIADQFQQSCQDYPSPDELYRNLT